MTRWSPRRGPQGSLHPLKRTLSLLRNPVREETPARLQGTRLHRGRLDLYRRSREPVRIPLQGTRGGSPGHDEGPGRTVVGKGVDLRPSRPGVQVGPRGPDEGYVVRDRDAPDPDVGGRHLVVGSTPTVDPLRGPTRHWTLVGRGGVGGVETGIGRRDGERTGISVGVGSVLGRLAILVQGTEGGLRLSVPSGVVGTGVGRRLRLGVRRRIVWAPLLDSHSPSPSVYLIRSRVAITSAILLTSLYSSK